jgi:cyclic pyranopterin phosphate synthase
MIVDAFHRVHDYLRISLTDNCNLRCFYCMPEEDYAFTPPSRLMQASEILGIAQTFVGLGVRKIRLTGGEPLVRKDVSSIISALGALPVTLTMTTNGTRLHHFLDVISASMVSVNISLDTLRADRFRSITRRDEFDVVFQNISALLSRGLHLKVNAVIMKGINEDEITDFVGWTRETPVHVRFIEFMPFPGNRWTNNQVVTWREMLDTISARYPVERLEDGPHDTAKGYRVPGHQGTFSVISTMSAPFCSTCNRLRLTADGKLKNCLFSAGETDLLGPWRRGEDVTALIRSNVSAKAKELGGHNLQANRSMITIGG